MRVIFSRVSIPRIPGPSHRGPARRPLDLPGLLDDRLLCWQACRHGALGRPRRPAAPDGGAAGTAGGRRRPGSLLPRHLPAHHPRGGRRSGRGGFPDPGWVERWDVAFADLYLDAVEAARGGPAPARPWDVAFSAPTGRPAPAPPRPARHERPHELRPAPVAAGLSSPSPSSTIPRSWPPAAPTTSTSTRSWWPRVGAEDSELEAVGGPRSLTDRLLQPLNRLATKRFLRESRAKVWANTRLLDTARRTGPERLRRPPGRARAARRHPGRRPDGPRPGRPHGGGSPVIGGLG